MISREPGHPLRWTIVAVRLTLADANAPRPSRLSSDVRRTVGPPHIPQRVAHLADRGLRRKRVAERDQDVLLARGGPLQFADPAVPLVAVPGGAQPRESFCLLFFDGRIDPQRLVTGL